MSRSRSATHTHTIHQVSSSSLPLSAPASSTATQTPSKREPEADETRELTPSKRVKEDPVGQPDLQLAAMVEAAVARAVESQEKDLDRITDTVKELERVVERMGQWTEFTKPLIEMYKAHSRVDNAHDGLVASDVESSTESDPSTASTAES